MFPTSHYNTSTLIVMLALWGKWVYYRHKMAFGGPHKRCMGHIKCQRVASNIKATFLYLLITWHLGYTHVLNLPVTAHLPLHEKCSYNLPILTHWGRATHTYVGKLTIIGSDNGVSPGRRQAIIWTIDGILLILPLQTNFNEILIGIQIFSLKKCIWKCRLRNGVHSSRPQCIANCYMLPETYTCTHYVLICIHAFIRMRQRGGIKIIMANNGILQTYFEIYFLYIVLMLIQSASVDSCFGWARNKATSQCVNQW